MTADGWRSFNKRREADDTVACRDCGREAACGCNGVLWLERTSVRCMIVRHQRGDIFIIVLLMRQTFHQSDASAIFARQCTALHSSIDTVTQVHAQSKLVASGNAFVSYLGFGRLTKLGSILPCWPQRISTYPKNNGQPRYVEYATASKSFNTSLPLRRQEKYV